MEKYIKKTDVLAEIKRRYKFHKERNRMEDSAIQDVLYGILNFLDTLEVKEVDLEKEYKDFVEEDPVYNKLVNNIVGKAIAKHFFELGMQQSNNDNNNEEKS